MCLYGGMGRRSLEADTRKIAAEISAMAPKAMPVFRFQFGGFVFHQPPDGVQTCLEQECEVGEKINFQQIGLRAACATNCSDCVETATTPNDKHRKTK